MIRIIAIIPTFNRKEKLAILLQQLVNQILPTDSILEIIVIINGLKDGTIEMIRQDFSSVYSIIGSDGWWYTRSMNEGFKYAQKLNPNFILTLNDDVEISLTYLFTLLNDFTSIHNTNSILGSLSISNSDDELILFSGIKKYYKNGLNPIPYMQPLSHKYNDSIKGIHETHELPGRGILIPNEILIRLNYFDERFIQYGSDTDFCFRAREHGIKIYISWNAKVRVNIGSTRIRFDSKGISVLGFLKSTLNNCSHDSLKKFVLFHSRHYPSLYMIWKIPFFYFTNIRNIMKMN